MSTERNELCRACNEPTVEGELEYCDPCLLDMESGDEDEEWEDQP